MKWTKLPKKKGNIDIYPEYHGNGTFGVTIIGTPKGLKYLAKMLNQLAETDQESSDAPDGTRDHYHLHPGIQLDDYSCEVELCRADAKGTGDLPFFMKRPR